MSYEEKTAKWEFYDQKFEYEQIIDPLETGWYGHVFFAYDLVRNMRPERIVELGTHKGHSFFTFCQAVKDGCLDTELFAIDTWKGDKHAGFYDDSVWETVNQVKESFYDSLRINLIRKNFDSAADGFGDQSIDILHIDGCHTYEAVKNDFERWVGKVKDNGVILLHDINERQNDFGVFRLWDELIKQYKTLEFYHSHGLGVLCKHTQGFSEIFDFSRIWRGYYPLKMDKKFLTINNQKKDLEISHLKDLTQQKDQEIAQKDQEIDAMKSTKFWKLRTLYASIMQFIRH